MNLQKLRQMGDKRSGNRIKFSSDLGQMATVVFPNTQSLAGRFPPNLPALTFSTDLNHLGL